jgi:putative ATPase
MEPLASKIRPKNLKEFVGQGHLVGLGMPIRKAIESRHLFSFILWGPPGVGKTTLARIYAQSLNAEFYELSAVSAGKDDIRRIIDDKIMLNTKPKVLFFVEIHRFNKAQQDFLLPHVESGAITLIGATTENPSFEVIGALLSRMRVFTLTELTPDDMKKIVKRAGSEAGIKLDKAAQEWIIEMAAGDARMLITTLETANNFYGGKTSVLSIENLKDTVQNRFLRFDKKGEEHYNTISAFIKSMRAGNPDSAIYYLARMLMAGEDPKFIARRMIIFASEDVGLAQPTALVVANEVFRAVEVIGMPECRINLAHGVLYLALAKKDRTAYDAIGSAMADVEKYGNLPIPMKIRNPTTKLMKEIGYGKDYEMYNKEGLLPDKLKNKKYLNGRKNDTNI